MGRCSSTAKTPDCHCFLTTAALLQRGRFFLSQPMQVGKALANDGDLVVGISTSGNSPNIFKALQEARLKGCRTVGLLGKSGGSIKDLCDLVLIIPSDDTPRIQEGHITIIHIVCDLMEKAMFH